MKRSEWGVRGGCRVNRSFFLFFIKQKMIDIILLSGEKGKREGDLESGEKRSLMV